MAQFVLFRRPTIRGTHDGTPGRWKTHTRHNTRCSPVSPLLQAQGAEYPPLTKVRRRILSRFHRVPRSPDNCRASAPLSRQYLDGHHVNDDVSRACGLHLVWTYCGSTVRGDVGRREVAPWKQYVARLVVLKLCSEFQVVKRIVMVQAEQTRSGDSETD